MEETMSKDGSSYQVYYAKEPTSIIHGLLVLSIRMKDLVGAYFVEAKWYNESHAPKLKEYISNALASSGYYMVTTTCLVSMGKFRSKEAFEWVRSAPKPIRSSTLTGRLMDDIFEQQSGHVASAVECYMEDNGVSEQEACDGINKMIDEAWKDVKKECFSLNKDIMRPLLIRVFNLTRMIYVIYNMSAQEQGSSASIVPSSKEINGDQEIVLKFADFHPSVWKDYFLEYNCDIENLNDKGELSRQPIFHSEETLNIVTSKTVMLDELSIMDEYWIEPEETLEVSLHEPNIIIAQNEVDETEKEVEVISERPEEEQKKSKEGQPLVLVKPPSLSCIPVEFQKGVVVKERSQIFYTADTFLSDDHDVTESYVLEVPNELLNLKEGMLAELRKAIDVSFVVDISKGKGIM
ncbi:hypothetical protein Sjap_011895 [Stephania japonica]|uniref:Terpene synthase metal-binding domain-containing protein n=1 Tax=Stephania japonica TaxID=461633 RepID=A0AAP0P5E7_9MAGN